MVSRLTRSSSNFLNSQRACRSRPRTRRVPPAGPVGRVEKDEELDLALDVGGQAVEGLFRDRRRGSSRAPRPGGGSG